MLKRVGIITIIVLIMLGSVGTFAVTQSGENVLNSEQTTELVQMKESTKATMSEYIEKYGLSDYDAGILIKDIDIASYFEECLSLGVDPKISANWITGNILGYVYKHDISIKELFLNPKRLSVILKAISDGKISSKQAKELFFLTLERNEEPEKIMKDEGMEQISDDGALTSVVIEVLDENASQIEEYKNGKTNMFDYFVGQVMKKTRGQANPVKVKEILTDELSKR